MLRINGFISLFWIRLKRRMSNSIIPRNGSLDVSIGQRGAPATPEWTVLLDICVILTIIISFQMTVVANRVVTF